MKLLDLTCNSCGAPLQVPETANFVTCNHCSTQLAVRRTDHVAFTEQIDRLVETTEQLTERLDNLSEQTEVSALDRQWELERESYILTGENGRRRLPTERAAVSGGIMIALFGCLWTAMAIGITSSAPNVGPFLIAKFVFPLFGVLFVLGGIARSMSVFSSAARYREAEERYVRQRNELLRKAGSSDDAAK